MDLNDQLERRVGLEPGHECYRFEGRSDRETVFERIHRPVLALAELARGSVGIESEHQACAKRTRLRQACDVSAVHDIEDAVREYQRTRKPADTTRELSRRADLAFE